MVRFLSRDLPKHFWSEDKGLTSIFILLCVSDFLLIPFFDHHSTFLFFLSRILWVVLLVAGIRALTVNKIIRHNLFSIPILLVAVNILLRIFDNQFLVSLEFAVKLFASLLLIGMVLVKVFEAGSVTIHRVIGSIVVYMLIGNMWADIFEFLYTKVPGSIQFGAADIKDGVSASSYLYLSFTTLTTTGFGDILPVSAASRTLVIIEQLVGVLYPVVLIGRLVSLVSGGSSAGQEEKK
jgi:hypothetical protein